MKINKQLLVAGIVTTVAAGSMIGAGLASADSNNSSSVIDKLASKFNLNKDEVKAVFEAEHEERQAERTADMSENLQEQVDKGTITAEQKTLIEAKMAQQQAERESQREAIQVWADENNIDMKYLMGGRGPKGMNDNRLEDAVKDGDLTEAQKTLIEAKREELKEAREANRDEMKQWAKDNNIDLEDVLPMGKGGPRHGMDN